MVHNGKGKVLEDVARVLLQRMEVRLVDPQVLVEIRCKFLLKLQLVLDDGHHVVILLYPHQYFCYLGEFLLV